MLPLSGWVRSMYTVTHPIPEDNTVHLMSPYTCKCCFIHHPRTGKYRNKSPSLMPGSKHCLPVNPLLCGGALAFTDRWNTNSILHLISKLNVYRDGFTPIGPS
jgi:hypothetical protein